MLKTAALLASYRLGCSSQLLSVFLFTPMYQFNHPGNCLFDYVKVVFIVLKYPKHHII